MVDINWQLGQGANSFDLSFNQGLKLGQAYKQQQAQNALTQYAINPDADGAFDNLAKVNPQYAIQERERRDAAQKQAQISQLIVAAQNGDKAASQQLLGVDYDTWSKIDKTQRDTFTENAKTLAEAARYADTPEKWDATIAQLAQRGLPVEQYLGKFSQESRIAAIIAGQQLDEYNKQLEPDYKIVPNDASLVNTKDPDALREFQTKRLSPENPADIPPPPPGFELNRGGGSGNATGNFPE